MAENEIVHQDKIKIVISDLHISKGRFHKDGSINSFEEFTKDTEFKDFLEYYSRGQFAESDIELIINGDLFNFFYIDYKGVFCFFVNQDIVDEQIRTGINGHLLFFEALKAFLKQPKRKLTYLIGNHDMHMYFESAQQIFEEFLEVKVNWKFTSYVFDGVHIEHGHQYEPLNRVDMKRIFLTKGYPKPVLNMPFATLYCLEFLTKVKKIRPSVDKVRPFGLYIRWGLWNDTISTLILILKSGLFLIKSKIINSGIRYKYTNFQIKLKTIKDMNLYGDLDKYANSILSSYQSIHTVIMGHTHVAKCRQWHNGKQYFNTGTWTDVLNLEVGSLGQKSKNNFVIIDYRQGPFPVISLHQWKGYWRPESEIG